MPVHSLRELRIMPSSVARSGRLGKRPRVGYVTAEQFRDARVFAGLDRDAAAELCGVCVRTVGHWETGACRPAYAAWQLLRVLHHGQPIDPAWQAFRFVRGGLVSPEGIRFEPSTLAWWGLTVARIRDLGHPGATLQSGGCTGAVVDSAAVPAAPSELRTLRKACRRPLTAKGSAELPSTNRGVSETERPAPGVGKPAPRRDFRAKRPVSSACRLGGAS